MVFNGARRKKRGVGNDEDEDEDNEDNEDNDDDDDDDDDDDVVAVSCSEWKREENGGRRAGNDAPLAFLLPADTMSGRISFSAVVTHPPDEGIVFLSKPELQISDTEPLCRTGF